MVRPIQRHYGFLSKVKPNTVASTGFVVLTSKDSIEPYFLYSFLTQDKITEYLDVIAEGSTSAYPAFTPDVIENLQILLPSIGEQRSIAKILSDLDSKIELNRSMNATLESIGRALFNRWFVDYEFPDEKGRPYKSSGGRMVYSPELQQEVPAGWGIDVFSNAVEINPVRRLSKGAAAKKVSMADLDPWKSWVTSWSYDAYSSGSRFGNGDVLFARITPSLENGKTALVSFLDEGEMGFGSTEFIVMSPGRLESSIYLYYLATSSYVRDYAIASMNGSSGRQRVPDECFDYLPVIVPPTNILALFDSALKPAFKQVQNNMQQTAELTQIRDSLLPKLMSGEIRVPT